jgi:hypothetical protein
MPATLTPFKVTTRKAWSLMDKVKAAPCFYAPFKDLRNGLQTALSRYPKKLLMMYCPSLPNWSFLAVAKRIRFPAPKLIQGLIHKRIGVETMDNGAACRTFNVLAGEGRHVVWCFCRAKASPSPPTVFEPSGKPVRFQDKILNCRPTDLFPRLVGHAVHF